MEIDGSDVRVLQSYFSSFVEEKYVWTAGHLAEN
jgi:hypothetical protein